MRNNIVHDFYKNSITELERDHFTSDLNILTQGISECTFPFVSYVFRNSKVPLIFVFCFSIQKWESGIVYQNEELLRIEIYRVTILL